MNKITDPKMQRYSIINFGNCFSYKLTIILVVLMQRVRIQYSIDFRQLLLEIQKNKKLKHLQLIKPKLKICLFV